ncbi:MAG: hypothetical protein ACI9KE_004791 [Polyangiales bacterium]|jgi:hypothetical protein
MLRYHDVLAGHSRDRAEIVPNDEVETEEPLATGDDAQLLLVEPTPPLQPPPPPSRHPWAWLLRRVFAVDIMTCPRCQSAMRVIAAGQCIRASGEVGSSGPAQPTSNRCDCAGHPNGKANCLSWVAWSSIRSSPARSLSRSRRRSVSISTPPSRWTVGTDSVLSALSLESRAATSCGRRSRLSVSKRIPTATCACVSRARGKTGPRIHRRSCLSRCRTQPGTNLV